MTQLLTTDDAIARYGGPTKFARRLSEISGRRVTPQRVNNWRSKELGHFPSWTFPFLDPAFRDDGLEAPLSLWGMDAPERRSA